MAWLEGLLSGWTSRSRDIEKQQFEEAQAANKREADLYGAILSSPTADDEIRAMAATGLLQSAAPRRRAGGLRGFMGEVQGNPMYPRVLEYLRTPRLLGYEPGEIVSGLARIERPTITAGIAAPTTPARTSAAGYLATPPAAAESAALPETSPTEAGAPAPAAPQPIPAPSPLGTQIMESAPTMPVPGAAGGTEGAAEGPLTSTMGTVVAGTMPPDLALAARPPAPPPTRPDVVVPGPERVERRGREIWGVPQPFARKEEEQIAAARAKFRGEIQSYAEMFQQADPTLSPTEARRQAADFMVQKEQRGMGGYQAYEVEYDVPDPANPGQTITKREFATQHGGQWINSQGSPIPYSIRKARPYSTMTGGTRWNQAMFLKGYSPDDVRQDPAKAQEVSQLAELLEGRSAYTRGIESGRAKIATEYKMPIGATAAEKYNVPPTTTLEELSNRVGLSDVQKERVYSLGQVDVLVKTIKELVPKVFPQVEPGIWGAIETAFTLGAKQLGRDENLAALDAAINAALAQVAQLSGQPGSRLSDTDLKLARRSLVELQPSLFGGDTLLTARARLGVIDALIKKAQGTVPASELERRGGAAGEKTPEVAAPPEAPPTPGPERTKKVTTTPEGAPKTGITLDTPLPDFDPVTGRFKR